MTDLPIPQHQFTAVEERAMRDGNRAAVPGAPPMPPYYAAPQGLSPKGQADVRGAVEDIARRATGD